MRLPYIDGLRGIAALAVFLIHSGGLGLRDLGHYGNSLVDLGKYGVTVFFVVSAYTLCLSADRAFNLRAYFARRAARILPMYFLVCIVAAAMSGAWISLAYHLTLVNIAAPQYANDLLLIEWTIPVEVSFYLLFPALFAASRRRFWMLAMLGGSALLYLFRAQVSQALGVFEYRNYTLIWHMLAFVLGIAVFRLRLRVPLAVLLIGAFLTVHFQEGYWTSAAVALITAGMISRGGARILEWQPLRYIGKISYSFYLLHFAILMVIGPWWALAATIAVASLTYFAIEEPFMRQKHSEKRVTSSPG